MATIKNRIFLCHASGDKKEVIKYYHKLKDHGLSPWVDKMDLLPGQLWEKEIPKAVRTSKFMIIFFSETAVSKRGYVQKEFKMALEVMDEMPDGKIFAIPVRLDDCQVPESFHHIHYTELFEEGAFERVINVIRYELKDASLAAEESKEDYQTISAEAHFFRGNDFFYRKEYIEAIEAYDHAIRINPDYAKAYNNKGFALGKLGQDQEAIEACDQAIRIEPNYAEAYYNKGNAWDELAKHKKAIEAYDQAIRINPDYADAYNNKGVSLDELAKHKEAIEAYDQAIRINPHYVDAYNNKGVSLDELGKHMEAIEAYDQAIRINPDYAVAYNNKGVSLDELGKEKEAQICFEIYERLTKK